MNQAIEQAIIEHTNKVWDQALKVGVTDERERIIKMLEELAYIDEEGHEMISEFKTDLIAFIRGEQK